MYFPRRYVERVAQNYQEMLETFQVLETARFCILSSSATRVYETKRSFPLVLADSEFQQSLTAGVSPRASRKCRRFGVTLHESCSPEQRGSPALYEQIRQEHVECRRLLAVLG